MSSRIEGTDVTVSDIILHEPGSPPDRSAATEQDIREAYNYVGAVSRGFEMVDGVSDISIELLCRIHEHLLVDVRGQDRNPGSIRTVPIVERAIQEGSRTPEYQIELLQDIDSKVIGILVGLAREPTPLETAWSLHGLA